MWVSIVGDAGRGKSCLLWYLCHTLKQDTRVEVLPFLADHIADSLGREIVQLVRPSNGRRRNGKPIVILIDTLDLLVGVNDAELARNLSALRALGCLLITTSRPQEADRLYQSCDRDFQVPLRRYTNEEFKLITHKYIEKSYPHWPEELKEMQFAKVTQLLEQQRDVARELDLEPLILRMIFEAYVPNDIPQDINTQKVYERFWQQRVLEDRTPKPAVQRMRSRICRFLAREIAFGKSALHGEAVYLDRLPESAVLAPGALPPEEVIEGLVSSGVLQWSMGRQAVRFFHQTFFEYTAAYDLLCLLTDERGGDGEVAALLADVAGSRFFRVPILKQLAVQDYYHGSGGTYREIVRSLRGIDSELAAQLVLEIAGKVEDPRVCVDICEEWIAANRNKIGAVICETVKHYPSRHVETALVLLRPYLDTSRKKAVYALCADSLAIIAPGAVGAFLRQGLGNVKSSSDLNEKNIYTAALLEAWYYGADGAMRDLARLSKSLTDGQFSNLLTELALKTNGENSEQVARFLSDVVLPAALDQKCEAKVWEPIVRLVVKVHEYLPDTMRQIGQDLLESERWRVNAASAVNTGKIVGRILADTTLIDKALTDLVKGDHALRLMSAEILRSASPTHAEYIIEHVLRVHPSGESQGYVDSLFRIVASLENVAAAKTLAFLERWVWAHGTGAALRETFRRLAHDSPAQSRAWLLARLDISDPALQRTYFIFFGVLAEANVEIFSAQDLAFVCDIASRSTGEVRRLLASVAGRVAVVDESLADRLIATVFANDKEEQHTAVIMSLEHCAESHPQFLLGQLGLIFQAALTLHRPRYLQALFRILKSFGRGPCELLLQRLDELFTEQVAGVINDGELLTEFIAVLKICAKSNPALAYRISTRCRITSSGVAKGLSALYANLADRSDDPQLLTEVLAGFVTVLQKEIHGNIVGNALGTALPRIDGKLGGRYVVDMVFTARRCIANEDTLVDLLNAAMRVSSFTQQDVAAMLNEVDPKFSRARGILLVKRASK